MFDPLHPAVVHFPLALAVLLPLAAVAALVLLRLGAGVRAAWIPVAVLAGLLALSAWIAVETGEEQEDRVEEVVPEEALHEHEEAGERVLWGGVAVFALTLLGLVPGRAGAGGRILGTAGALAVTALAVDAGSKGGELVYRHDAARAYVQPAPGAPRARSDADSAGERTDREEEPHTDEGRI